MYKEHCFFFTEQSYKVNLRPPTSSNERAVKPTEDWSTYSLIEDNFESSFNICRVFHVHRVYVGLSDGLCIRMLGRHLWKQRWSVKTVQLIYNLRTEVCGNHLPDGGLVLEEVRVQPAQWRVQPGVQENTAIGQGFQGGGAFVGKRQAHQNLKARGRRLAIRRREAVKERDYITEALWCNNHVCKI